ncbi:di-trans,poly-cis-decaprenylcistransferase [Patescibacteria group bacterium]|nr:di-trans,poly-cis-decaprenylcistransferase [Patescibacteria group bacterium]
MDKTSKDFLPNHVAIVPDGNRRWAKTKGYAPWRGHFVGAERTEELVRAALDAGIYCLSIWGSSRDNLETRSKMEIKALLKIYERYFKKLLKSKEIHENKVKIDVIGCWSETLPDKIGKVIKELIESTKNYNGHLLNFFISYNGTDEMLAAIKNIVKEARENKNLRINPQFLEKHLWSGHLPAVDFLIRTGSANDPHNSVGFMMWQTANTQYYFTNTLYPDFGKEEFNKALVDFIKRQRRFGK